MHRRPQPYYVAPLPFVLQALGADVRMTGPCLPMPEAKLLRRSFLHLPKISAAGEARLWAAGISDWIELVRHTPVQYDLYRKGASALQSAVEASEEALANRDVDFFARRLPKREFYRIAASFPESCTFLDIESTGLSPYYDQVTLVGWSVGSTYTVLVDPTQIDQLEHDLHEHPILVTFNGSLFDLPFLTKHFKTDWSDTYHVDLRYLAKRAGLTGGQKKIEQEIGLTREGSLSDITGAQAVALWFDYKEGDLNALRDLVCYNHADIEGMKFLFETVIRRVVPPTFPLSSNGDLFPRSNIYFPHTDDISCENAIFVSPYTGTIGPRLTYSELRGYVPKLDQITIVGLDLTGSEQRKSGWAAVTGQHLEVDLVGSDSDLISRTLDAEPFLVSIDSPLSLPTGRISEFDDDPGREEYGIVREAERLLRSRGVHVYPALLPSMQRLTRRGINLATRLRKLGIPVIESYPGAAQDILGIPRKKTSLRHLTEGLRRFGYAALTTELGISHDELDAATSALVGQFMLAGYWEALGSAEEDYLVVPTVKRRSPDLRSIIAVGLSGPIAAGKTTAARLLERMGFRYCRYSEIIARELQARGTPIRRSALQQFGEEVHRSRFGQRKLQNKLAACVEQASRIVVDGLRHPEDSAFLRERWGTAALHLHVNASLAHRVRRYTFDTDTSEEDFRLADSHPVEQNVQAMQNLADATLSNDGTIQDLESILRNIVGER